MALAAKTYRPLIGILGLLALAACAGPYGTEFPNIPAQALRLTGLGDSERIWCEDAGGTLSRRIGTDGMPVGMCVFSGGQECDVQRVARGLCPPGIIGYGRSTKR